MTNIGLMLGAAFLTAQQTPAISYFPEDLAGKTIACADFPGSKKILSDFERRWYSQHLAAAGEPSLAAATRPLPANDGITLRLTWLRSFDPPVTVRVSPAADGGYRLFARQLAGAGGYAPGEIAKQVDRALTAVEAMKLRALVAETAIFAEPPVECGMATDGAQWIIEGVDKAGYHFLNRQSPENGPIRTIGMHLLGLTGWTFAHIY